jgi:hypothetical protein
MSEVLKNMLLIDEPTISLLKNEMTKIAGWFVLPSFVIALIWEYFADFKFYEVVKNLILILIFIGAFYSIHTEGVKLSLQGSEELLRRVSPQNIFLRKWSEVKVKTEYRKNKVEEKTGWHIIDRFVVPNLNDLLGTAMFLMSKLFIWILKLIYSTVYHLTYIFAPLSAVLFFFPVTRGSISGTILSSLWCMLLPFVLVAILGIVGNSIQVPAHNGELAISSIDQILWLFGVTLLILMTPVFTLGLLKGAGVATSGTAAGMLMTSSGMKLLSALPVAGFRASQIKNWAMHHYRKHSNRHLMKNGMTPPSMRGMDGPRAVGELHGNNSRNGQPISNFGKNGTSSTSRPFALNQGKGNPQAWQQKQGFQSKESAGQRSEQIRPQSNVTGLRNSSVAKGPPTLRPSMPPQSSGNIKSRAKTSPGTLSHTNVENRKPNSSNGRETFFRSNRQNPLGIRNSKTAPVNYKSKAYWREVNNKGRVTK